MRKEFTIGQIQTIIQLYKDGNTIQAIAETFKVNKDVIRLRLLENNIEIRRNGSWQKEQRPANYIEVPPSDQVKISALWEQNLTLLEIAGKFNFNVNKVRDLLNEAGINTNRHKKKAPNIACHICSKSLRKRPSRLKDINFCSKKCRGLHNQIRTEIKCATCFTKFSLIPSKAGKAKYCSPECSAMALQTGSFNYCGFCGSAFYSTASRNKKFCSKECCNKAQVTAVIVNCNTCSREVLKNLCHLQGRNTFFCNYSCYFQYRKENNPFTANLRQKQSESRLLYYKNNPDAREDQRKRMINNFIEGKYPKTRTKPHLLVCDLLTKLKIDFIEEYPLGNYVADIFLPEYQMVIEIQGTYWHADPRFYDLARLNGTQEKNVTRDKLKTGYITQKRNLKLLEVWEYDIKNNLNEVRENLLTNLKTCALAPNSKNG